ncbi:barstar family protein [Paenibacillus sp. WQ 127069]|uniref:Barstar family protein n=1 Tax=Paenibacillus baimaensis TaxID=2982185 RepID=A0ABT2UEN7_9BACL|nr:barstar family protein [Paenibacillus sp. WQ 127069]MCU6792357.1 barstar family protein [Paenibacillus sp. WQ 127069]
MENKFSVIDDESGLTVGTCSHITGLTGEDLVLINDESFNIITLMDFQFNEIFKTYCLEKKKYINNLQLIILNKFGTQIGRYYFYLSEPIYFHKFGFWKGRITRLIGILPNTASNEALVLWNSWRVAFPEESDTWINLTYKQRIGWLEVIRLFNGVYSSFDRTKDKKGGTYYLDGVHIRDRASFYCSLGEAINGPGGYFGVCLDSLSDCLCGGFGAQPPFTIQWKNVDLFLNNNHIDNEENKNLNHDNRVYFTSILELFVNNNITVIFSP